MRERDTIIALATAAGAAARVIVRCSGAGAFEIARQLGAKSLAASRATAVSLTFAGLRTRALCYAFRGPRSQTGEDVVEYHLPGNLLLARMLIEEACDLGARPAQAGEFSARAFFNGKLRLDEAEGVAAVIAASNDRELSAARRLRAGELARRLAPSLEALADLLALCELGIDFTEEDVVVLEAAEARRRIAALRERLAKLLEQSPRLEQLGQPPRIAIVGRPNAGKSTLLNALAGYRRAVASEQAGTTRDALSAEVDLPSGRVTLVDVAGLGEAPADAIEAAAHRRALREAETADVVMLLREAGDARPDPPLPRGAASGALGAVVPRSPNLRVTSKIDLAPAAPSAVAELAISALTGAGMDELRRRLGQIAFSTHGGAESLALSSRHREQIAAALAALEEAEVAVEEGRGPELLALYLREALDALGAILGTVSPDDLLGRIFGRFCIGK